MLLTEILVRINMYICFHYLWFCYCTSEFAQHLDLCRFAYRYVYGFWLYVVVSYIRSEC
jgi:hypothetical protein